MSRKSHTEPDEELLQERADTLESKTTLSPQQSKIAAYHEFGFDREAIGERMNLEVGSVDSNLYRIRRKRTDARFTDLELSSFFYHSWDGDVEVPHTGVRVFYHNTDAYTQRYLLPAIRDKHRDNDVRETTFTDDSEECIHFQKLPFDELPKVVFYDEGQPVDTVDAFSDKALNRDLLNYLTRDLKFTVRRRFGLVDEEPVELS